jgi:hypothetical protein
LATLVLFGCEKYLGNLMRQFHLHLVGNSHIGIMLFLDEFCKFFRESEVLGGGQKNAQSLK